MTDPVELPINDNEDAYREYWATIMTDMDLDDYSDWLNSLEKPRDDD